MKKIVMILNVVATFAMAEYNCLSIGHRGACGYAPENTIASFAKALLLNVDMVELDVYLCASRELVVIHDRTLERTTNGRGNVETKSFSELHMLDAGSEERIPSLTQVCDFIARRAIINVELKGDGTDKAVVAFIGDYVGNKGWSYTDFLISSFDHHKLRAVKRALPQIQVSALLEGIPITMAAFALECDADAIGISAECISQEYVDDAHRRGLKVYVFTVNEPDDIERIKALRVDGIISNYPDRVRTWGG